MNIHIASLRAALVALVTGLLLAPGLTTAAQADAPAPDEATVGYEVDFMTGMIDHHQMAIEMSQMCLEEAVHEELTIMCEDIIAAQSQEITTMQSWLQDWYDVDYAPTMSTADLTAVARVERLEASEFEIAFMRSMTKHHWRAVREAQQCVENAYHDELVALCEGIISTQLAEIEQLKTWLCEWYDRCGGRSADTA
jgi:uncharacterized protein (DUF305 family)